MERLPANEPEALEAFFKSRFSGWVRHTETDEILHVDSDAYEIVEELSLNGVYEHYKSTPANPKLYYVGRVVQNIESAECLVVYCPLYETNATYLPARPLNVFTDIVIVDGQQLPRFGSVDGDD